MKRIFGIVISYLLLLLFFGGYCLNSYAASSKKVTVDYNNQTMTAAVSKIKDHYKVPLNDIITAWGGGFTLDKKTNTMTAVVGKLSISVRNGYLTAKVSGNSFKMESVAVLQNGVMYVPINLFTEALGIKATLNDSKTTVLLEFDQLLPDIQSIVTAVPPVKPKFTYSVNFKGFFNSSSKNVNPMLDTGILLAPSFNKSTAQYIFYYADIRARNLAVTVNMPVTFKYYKKDGKLFQTISSTLTLEKGYTGSTFWWGFGYTEPGCWTVDKYRLDIYFWDDLVDRQYFSVFSLKEEDKAAGGSDSTETGSAVDDDVPEDIPKSMEAWKGIWVKEADLRDPVAGVSVHGFRFYADGRVEDVSVVYGYNDIYDKAGNLLPPREITSGVLNGYYSVQKDSIIFYQKVQPDKIPSDLKGIFKRDAAGFNYDGDKNAYTQLTKGLCPNGKYIKFPDSLIGKDASLQ